ncbi:hypothetical protein QBC47DRAFT_360018 [Echria macrotheca]|uniref:Uncharacterized protein n=1 Tax=Echria macrotheca TaxID=438768 RepID=A0AAJ0BE42_9PEZI|nr:hypothetical protein QBC47DRAFT_360018 [Echria macrotheca]
MPLKRTAAAKQSAVPNEPEDGTIAANNARAAESAPDDSDDEATDATTAVDAEDRKDSEAGDDAESAEDTEAADDVAINRATRRGRYTTSASDRPRGLTRMSNAFSRYWDDKNNEFRASVALWMTENRPVLETLDDVKKISRRIPISDKWTKGNQKQAERNWAKDGFRRNKLDTGSNGGLLTLYRLSLTFFGCLPEEILSPERSLEYDFAQNQTSRRIWVSQFCEQLSKLLFHPMFRQDLDRLATAVQYVVIVMSSDRRPWEARLPEDCGPSHFLHKLQSASQAAPGRKLASLRRQLSDAFQGKARSKWDMLFERIEALARNPYTVCHVDPTRKRYPVQKKHLDILESALDSVQCFGFPMFPPAAVSAATIKAKLSVKTYPGRKDFDALRDYAMLSEHEMELYSDRNQTEPASPVPPNTMSSQTKTLQTATLQAESLEAGSLAPRKRVIPPTPNPARSSPAKRLRLVGLSNLR